MSIMMASVLGLSLGLKHACEADHVAAVCTFVARGATVSRAAQLGAWWGLGHGAVMTVAGAALVGTGATVPAAIARSLDAAVAVMLIVLGAKALLSRSRGPNEKADKPHPRRPLLVGLVHGASGTAALSLLAASTMDTQLSALVFIGVFSLSAVLAMALFAALVAWPAGSLARRSPSLGTQLQVVTGLASIAAGLAVAASMA